MKSTLTLTAIVFAFCAAPALCAEFPKSGEAVYDTYYIDRTVTQIASGPDSGALVESTGINRNVKGEGPFNDMSVICLYHWAVLDGKDIFDGSCVETDPDGDTVFTTFDSKAHYFKGGTGKYKGITGEAPFTIKGLHDTADGRRALIITHKATWEIK